MAGQRQPTAVVMAKGKKHFTKDEIQKRLDSEVKPITDGIAPPSFLTTKKQKDRFDKISGQLQKLKIMGETDVEALGRYIIAQEAYEQAAKDLRAVQRQRPKGDAATVETLVAWADMLEKIDRRLERYHKQAHTLASSLGLNITGRCKLVVPVKDEAPKRNKFAQFGDMTKQGGVPVHDHVQ